MAINGLKCDHKRRYLHFYEGAGRGVWGYKYVIYEFSSKLNHKRIFSREVGDEGFHMQKIQFML